MTDEVVICQIAEAIIHLAGDVRLIRESMERYEVHFAMALHKQIKKS